jgi:hypothetical protein
MTKSQLATSFPAKHDDDSLMSDDNRQSRGGTNAIGTNTLREEDRDEVKEIQKMSQTETRLIRTWRVILLVLLVVTAAAVSSITYVLLKREEDAAYKATVCTTYQSRCECLVMTQSTLTILCRLR